MLKIIIFLIVVISTIGCTIQKNLASNVLREGDKTYIVDRTGFKWDVTQAETLGFKAERFQYGIGKNAFTPLDDTYLSDDSTDVSKNLRVIGVKDGSFFQAYSVSRLSHHEISNSNLGSEPIAVGY